MTGPAAPRPGRAARHAARLLDGLPVHVVQVREDRDDGDDHGQRSRVRPR
ncbi:MAG: hypothetical protein ACRDS0_15915 [Pseudonocardiaceae bacterium]